MEVITKTLEEIDSSRRVLKATPPCLLSSVVEHYSW